MPKIIVYRDQRLWGSSMRINEIHWEKLEWDQESAVQPVSWGTSRDAPIWGQEWHLWQKCEQLRWRPYWSPCLVVGPRRPHPSVSVGNDPQQVHRWLSWGHLPRVCRGRGHQGAWPGSVCLAAREPTPRTRCCCALSTRASDLLDPSTQFLFPAMYPIRKPLMLTHLWPTSR